MKYDIDALIKLINGVGFPIVVCVALFWSNQTSVNAQQVLLAEFKETIRNNTDALNALSNKIDSKEKYDVRL